MEKNQLIECVPNFSEGRDLQIIKQITNEIESVEGVKLLDVDPGKATNRTVVTFVGQPDAVIQAAYLAIKKASEIIDMSKHQGEHPRMGATDVCPLIPIANITMEEVVHYAHQLGEMLGKELDFPFYMYEAAATQPSRKNLATIRAGEYEALPEKIKNPDWKPDYGPAKFNPKAGATAIGARDFLIAYNVNLNTTSVRRANAVAFDVREQGRVKRKGNPVTGPVVRDKKGNPVRLPGKCKSVKGIGWFIEEYGIAQISMNLTNINVSPLHLVFEACRESAAQRGMRVTGSELVGLVPLKVMLDAGHYFLRKQQRSLGIPEREIIQIAVKSLGLDELSAFDPQKKIIEYQLEGAGSRPLARLSLEAFADEVASESPAPGGGSVAAYLGALAASLGTMVANLSAHKRGWDRDWEQFSTWAQQGEQMKSDLLKLVDEDTRAFHSILEAFRLPKGSESEKESRNEAIQSATRHAIETPFRTMQISLKTFELIEAMVEKGNPNSVTDAGVAALSARAAIHAAFLNVKINVHSLKDKKFVAKVLKEGKEIIRRTNKAEKEILKLVEQKIKD